MQYLSSRSLDVFSCDVDKESTVGNVLEEFNKQRGGDIQAYAIYFHQNNKKIGEELKVYNFLERRIYISCRNKES